MFYLLIIEANNFQGIIICFIGYGDSTGKPTEKGLAEDAQTIYDYVKKLAPKKKLIVWGHSMGTGVAALAVSELCNQKIGPDALVLESPFNNLRDVVRHHPFSVPLRFLPFFDLLIVDPLIRSGLVMNTDERLKRFVFKQPDLNIKSLVLLVQFLFYMLKMIV